MLNFDLFSFWGFLRSTPDGWSCFYYTKLVFLALYLFFLKLFFTFLAVFLSDSDCDQSDAFIFWNLCSTEIYAKNLPFFSPLSLSLSVDKEENICDEILEIVMYDYVLIPSLWFFSMQQLGLMWKRCNIIT